MAFLSHKGQHGRIVVADCPSQFSAKQVDNLFIGKRLSAGKRVRNIIRQLTQQCLYRHSSEVAHIDKAGAPRPCWDIDLTAVTYFSSVDRVQVLHKKARPQKGEIEPELVDFLLNGSVRHKRIFFDSQ